MTNKEKFLTLVTEDGNATVREIEYRYKNRDWLTESFRIAIKVLMRLDELKWTQKDLAAAMEVKPQQVNRILRGKQNLTLDTLIKLQNILGIGLLASFDEKSEDKVETINIPEKKAIPVYRKRKSNEPLPGAAARQQL